MKEIINPYREIIEWLRSPDGESWSEQRMKEARFKYRINNQNYYDTSPVSYDTLVNYSDQDGPVFLGGVLSVKEDG